MFPSHSPAREQPAGGRALLLAPPIYPTLSPLPCRRPSARGACAIRCITCTHPQTCHHRAIERLCFPHPSSVTSASMWDPPAVNAHAHILPLLTRSSFLTTPYGAFHHHALDLAMGQSAHHPQHATPHTHSPIPSFHFPRTLTPGCQLLTFQHRQPQIHRLPCFYYPPSPPALTFVLL